MRIMGRYKYVEGLETLHFVNLTREERSAFNKHGRLHGSVPVLSLWQYYSGGLPVSKILSVYVYQFTDGTTGLRGYGATRDTTLWGYGSISLLTFNVFLQSIGALLPSRKPIPLEF